ncbi:MAG: hypothetical protein JWM27_2768 [Gemmatimonadetes bacterium]|nr:hypothetical protein [Gemmatimonadota bacterium]
MTLERRLISIRRLVPAERRAEYDDTWRGLHAAVTAVGAHAWRFRSDEVEGLFLEFLEFGTDADIRAELDVLNGIKALHEGFHDPYPMPRTIEEWIEVPTLPLGVPE